MRNKTDTESLLTQQASDVLGFTRIGFFHFVLNHGDPIPELRSAIKSENKATSVHNCLIVLPEAFNIRKPYKEPGNCNHDPAVLVKLQHLAKVFQVTFVAGLIIHEYEESTPPYSSAYLIDETCFVLMCRKRLDDHNLCTHYSSCDHGYDHHNPTWHNNVCLIALICIDSGEPERKDALIASFPESHKTVCIPACMASPNERQLIALNWRDCDVILANSDPNGIGSFVSRSGTIVVSEVGNDNKVLLI